jgi:hypothetical protein
MSCLVCRELEQSLEACHREYIEARASTYYRVTRKFAAEKNVEMERARIALEEHRLICAAAPAPPYIAPARAVPIGISRAAA